MSEVLTRKQASKFLSISLTTLKTWTKNGLIQAYSLGGRIYYKRSELVNSLQKLETIQTPTDYENFTFKT